MAGFADKGMIRMIIRQRRGKQISALLLMTVILCCGCSNHSSWQKAKDRYVVGVVTKSNTSEYWMSVNSGMEAAAAKYDMDVITLAPDSELDREVQEKQVEKLIDQNVDALAVAPIDSYHVPDYLDEIEDFVHGLGVESYRNEVAECRTEFFNLGDDITPPAEVYQKLIKEFAGKVEDNIGSKKSLAKTTEALRVVYYEIAGKILETGKQVIPCYAGVSNVHINYDGGVWPCCVLGYEKEMGNLRDYEYDFQKLWRSPRAEEVRAYIKSQNCACPLANQGYSNILMHVPSLVKAGRKMLEFSRK